MARNDLVIVFDHELHIVAEVGQSAGRGHICDLLYVLEQRLSVLLLLFGG